MKKGAILGLDDERGTRSPFLRNYKLRYMWNVVHPNPYPESVPGLDIKTAALCQSELDSVGKSRIFHS